MTTFTWTNAAGGNWSVGTNWSGGAGAPGATDNAVIALPGTYTVTQSGTSTVAGVVLDDAAGTLAVNGDLNAGTLTLDAGVFVLDGTLANTTVLDNGPPLQSSNGTLSDVSWRGTLNVVGASRIDIINGLTVTGADGVSPGVVDAYLGDVITVSDNETFNNVTWNFSNGVFLTAQNVTFGAAATMNVFGYSNFLSFQTLVNNGDISFVTGEQSVGTSAFTNTGVVALWNDVSVSLQTNGSFLNSGLIYVSAGSSLVISAATFDPADLGDLQALGRIVLRGTLANVGNTISLTPGGTFDQVSLDGMLQGGNVIAQGGTLFGDNTNDGGSSTLQAVTWIGPFDTEGNWNVDAATQFQAVGGGPEAFNLDGAALTFAGPRTLNNLSIHTTGYDVIGVTTGNLTLGPAAFVTASDDTGVYSELNFTSPVINQGSILATGSGEVLSLGSTFTNNGWIGVENGASLAVNVNGTSGGLLNSGTIALGDATTSLVLYGTEAVSDLGTITSAGGQIVIEGTLDNTGGTLVLAPGSGFGNLAIGNYGMLQGGTVLDQGGSVSLDGATLSELTWRGPIHLLNDELTLNDVIVQTVDGGPGTIALDDSSLFVAGSGTLDAVSVEASGAYDTVEGDQTYPAGAGALILGSGATLNAVDGGTSVTLFADNVTNYGTINIAGSAEAVAVQPANFTNAGLLNVADDGLILFGPPLNYYEPVAIDFNNSGQIVVGSGGTVVVGTEATYDTPVPIDFDNSGQIVIGSGGTLQIGYFVTSYVNTGTISLADPTSALELNGTVAVSALGTIVGGTGQLIVGGLFDNTGNLLTIGPAGDFATLQLGGTIRGGTIAVQGGTALFNGGTLDDVVWDGPLAVGDLAVENGFHLEAPGGGPAIIALTGDSYASLDFLDSETLSDVRLTAAVGAGVEGTEGIDTVYGSATLTFDAATTIEVAVGTAVTLTLGAVTLINDGLIANTLATGSSISVAGMTFINDGTIEVSGPGNELVLQPATFVNAGRVSVTDGATLSLDALGPSAVGAFSNSGIISIDATSTLLLGGTLTQASFAAFATSGGVIELAGTLLNAGDTLQIAPSTQFDNLVLDGTIQGGTVIDQGGTLSILSATLDGVIWQAPVDLSQAFASLQVIDGTTLEPLSGNSQALINLTGPSSSIEFDVETVTNTQVTLGALGGGVSFSGPAYYPYAVSTPIGSPVAPPPTLTLASSTTLDAVTPGAGLINLEGNITNQGLINDADGNVALGSFTPSYDYGDDGGLVSIIVFPTSYITFDNQGTILAEAGAGSTFTVGDLTTLTNEGLIQVGKGDDLVIQTSTFDNTGTLAFTGAGTIEFAGSISNLGTIQFTPGAAELLILDRPATLITASIENFAIGDAIEFSNSLGIYAASFTAPGTITAVGIGGTYVIAGVTVASGVAPNLTIGTDLSTGDAYIEPAPGGPFSWTGAVSRDYATAGNWQGHITATAADPVSFSTNPRTVTGTGSALAITVGGSGTWTFAGATLSVGDLSRPDFFTPGIEFDTSAILNASTLAVNGLIDITGTNGATVTAEGGSFITTLGDDIGGNSFQSGALVVTGAGTTWDEQAGGYGMDLGEASYDTGAVTVTDGATLVSQSPVRIGIAYQGSGDVTVSDGGQWAVNGTGGVLDGIDGTGALTVDGGTLTDASFLTVGVNSDGSGTLNLTSGTISTAGNFNVGLNGPGIATIGSGGSVLAGGTFTAIGYAAGSNGSLIISAGGTFEATAPPQTDFVFVIGAEGSCGMLAAAQGSVLVTGAGALLTTNGSPLGVGGDGGGDGTLTVSQGGLVVAGTPDSTNNVAFAVASGTLSSGTVMIDGPGSALTTDGYALIARGGTGNLLIENSARMVVNDDATGDGGIGIGDGGYSDGQVVTVGNGSATVTAGGMLDINSTTSGIIVGALGAGGTLTVNSGTVLAGEHLTVGSANLLAGTVYGGTGTVTIGADGTVEVTNPTATATSIQIGTASSAVGGPTDTANGMVIVSGTGALLDGNDGGVGVGLLANGALTVSQGGSVVSGSPNDGVFYALAIGRQGDGSVTITDPGSTFTVNGGAFVGRAGIGHLTIKNQGSLFVGEDGLGNGGIAIGGAGTSQAGALDVGGTGTALVTTGGHLFSQFGVAVGENGASGSLTIDSGGTVEAGTSVSVGNTTTLPAGGTEISSSGTETVSVATTFVGAGAVTVGAGGVLLADGTGISGAADLAIGAGAGSSGIVNVTGSGALVESDNGTIVVGGAGTGGLEITDDGVVNAGTGAIDIAASAAGAGSVTVIGNEFLLSNTSSLVVGDGGIGSLAILAGGIVITDPHSASVAAIIANTAGASGSSVNVTGGASNWEVGGALVVGNAAEGSLNIAAGATVSATALNLGSEAFSDGLVSISGDNSSLAVTGTLSVGGAGSGELSILSGANVNIGGDFDIGQTTGGTGDVDIEDPGGTVFVGGNLNLGDGAAGVLTVGPNSTLEVDNGGVIAGPHGVENLFSAIDPFFSDGGTANILDSADQTYKAYVESTSFNLSPGISYTLNTPIIYGSSGFALGVNSSDSSGVELILNADSLSTASNVTFNDALSTLVIGADVLPSIELPASGTGPFTAAANPNPGLPLIGGFDGTIKDFQVGDTIVVDTKVAATFHQNGSLVSVIANTTTLGVLTFDSLANATLAVITPGALVDQAPCFAAGTRIAAERGEVAVEDLRVGDLVRVVLGGGVIARSEATRQSPSSCAAVWGLLRFARNDSGTHDSAMPTVPESPCAITLRDEPIGDPLAPIIWVGRREVDCAQHPKPRTVWPVRVSAGAFGPGRPHTDLLLSPDHAVYVGEVLIPVKHLINGSTIAQVLMDHIVYHHIELPQHDVLLAQGLPAESFLDMRDGTNYANRPGPVRLYPDFSVRMWEAFGCARLIVTGPELEAARALVAHFATEQEAARARVRSRESAREAPAP